MNPALRANLIFSSLLVAGAVISGQMGLFIVHQIWDVRFQWSFFQYCASILTDEPAAHNFIKILFNLVILYTVGKIIWRVYNQICLTRKWLKVFAGQKHVKLTKQLNSKYRKWGTEFIVVKDEKFIALTLGLVRPRIVVSTGTLSMFSNHEVEAVLFHEWYHCQQRDPLQLFLLTLILDGMGYIPAAKAAMRDFKTLKELLADSFAIRQMGTEYYLGNVLLKFSNAGQMQQSTTAVYFAEHAINYRIMQVLEPTKRVHIPKSNFKPLLIVVSLIVLMSSIILGGCS
ncbi:M56 family metallopeptidase [Paenibacillus sp. GCM10012307]|uniref:M56 family metallopeptidase n=1 Tax=Paenibacillus roseus TaxID=2798579 RepID=A0A934MVW0_9BACL|nr:M56 family metallopeptidase [Paenibacillus roseus]MBJ6362532.1 M56 family metallopeptidase [Paenibacillus roseus]